MRGLDIRVSFALARIAEITDPETWDMIEVQCNAEALGRNDYWNGRDEVPTMFADEPYLRDAWKRGNADAEMCEELENCASCIAARGDPCPIHG
ncbi:hypothetical protein LGM57_33585 [Burkholderia cepacia]|uniref:hypothetical protein n=1 Tax=Burkholderia cepacia complex TaxID=87882 RepID=UPI000B63655E|nr:MULTISPECIES: hypothetical protein [Burkholderia cepacia complex]MCA7981267.1 hypothetical protein [Burkholderia cepacia]OUE46059.1 hypothetical protein BZY94_09600 [Burkholderia territorii]HDR9497299.1 hypothetical protein [Burkholderia cepacia]